LKHTEAEVFNSYLQRYILPEYQTAGPLEAEICH